MTASVSGSSRLWIDVDDLVDYLEHHHRPSGIQRVVYELCRALEGRAGDRIGFLRRGAHSGELRTLDWPFLDNVFRNTMNTAATGSGPDAEPAPATEPPGTEDLIEASAPEDPAAAVPEETTDTRPPGLNPDAAISPARRMLQLQVAVGLGLITVVPRVGVGIARWTQSSLEVRRTARQARKLECQRELEPVVEPTVKPPSLRERLPEGTRLEELARPGDAFIVLGANWHRQDYSRTIRHVRDDLRVRVALLMYDLVPVRHPEWCNQGMSNSYISWHDMVLPLVDQVFAISDATARDVSSYLVENGILDRPVQPIALGTGFSGDDETAPSVDAVISEPYVLFVSTLEARKNHALLFRVWRRLLSEFPPERVPLLVFAGREGWLVSDLMQQLRNTDWLDGRIRFVRNPTDAELHRLYADCLFTVFPSLFEGWGLPVTESLGMGKPCVASNTTSIPEAGGALARYFNPYDVGDAYRVIRDTLLDREGLARWTAEVRDRFCPTSWDNSAATILETLGVT